MNSTDDAKNLVKKYNSAYKKRFGSEGPITLPPKGELLTAEWYNSISKDNKIDYTEVPWISVKSGEVITQEQYDRLNQMVSDTVDGLSCKGCADNCYGACAAECGRDCVSQCHTTCTGCGSTCSTGCKTGCTNGCHTSCVGNCTDSNCSNGCYGSCTGGCSNTAHK